MWLFWLLLGFLIGLFIPTSFGDKVKRWLKSLWKKVSGWFKKTDDGFGI